MTTPQVSMQLIIFGERNEGDIAGVLKDVQAAGFAAFEAGNLFASYGEENVRGILQETGLTVSGAHYGYGTFADTADLQKQIAYAQAIGLKRLMCSGVAENSTEGYKQSAAVFNEAGRRLADAGLSFNYHNHDWEFNDLGGVTGMDILAAETDPALVKFNIDVFWLYYAGQAPAAFIAKHADRTGYFHFKDGRKIRPLVGKPHPEFLELGRGEVDLKAAYTAAVQASAEWIVYEQDNTQKTPLESATISRDYLKSTLGI